MDILFVLEFLVVFTGSLYALVSVALFVFFTVYTNAPSRVVLVPVTWCMNYLGFKNTLTTIDDNTTNMQNLRVEDTQAMLDVLAHNYQYWVWLWPDCVKPIKKILS